MFGLVYMESNHSKLFQANDFDFSGYPYPQLELICRYQLPIKTHFPKLVAVLYSHPKFQEWLQEFSLKLSEERIIELLIQAVQESTLNSNGNLERNHIDLFDSEIWKHIVDRFFQEKGGFSKKSYQNFTPLKLGTFPSLEMSSSEKAIPPKRGKTKTESPASIGEDDSPRRKNKGGKGSRKKKTRVRYIHV